MATQRTGAVIVVGASSGVGRALAMQLAHEARQVAIVARRGDVLAEVALEVEAKVGARRAHAYEHDVEDADAADQLFTKIEADLGQVDEVHYLAGVLRHVAIDEFAIDKDAEMVRINTIGCMAWVDAAARRFQLRKAGHIVGVTSVAGDRGRRDRPGYNASKAGQDAFLESVRNRLWRHGVRVTTVRLGPTDTPMTAGIDTKMAISPDTAARAILKARDRGRAIVYVPGKWRLIMFVIRSIPSFVFRRLDL